VFHADSGCSAGRRRGKGSALWGTLLLFLYSVGHGTLAVIAGTSVGFVQKLARSGTYGKLSKIFTIVMGALILMIGFYMFYLGF
jgi:cytochrome c biogenesis protein CcdA